MPVQVRERVEKLFLMLFPRATKVAIIMAGQCQGYLGSSTTSYSSFQIRHCPFLILDNIKTPPYYFSGKLVMCHGYLFQIICAITFLQIHSLLHCKEASVQRRVD